MAFLLIQLLLKRFDSTQTVFTWIFDSFSIISHQLICCILKIHLHISCIVHSSSLIYLCNLLTLSLELSCRLHHTANVKSRRKPRATYLNLLTYLINFDFLLFFSFSSFSSEFKSKSRTQAFTWGNASLHRLCLERSLPYRRYNLIASHVYIFTQHLKWAEKWISCHERSQQSNTCSGNLILFYVNCSIFLLNYCHFRQPQQQPSLVAC